MALDEVGEARQAPIPGVRHPATLEMMEFFTYSHLPPHLQKISSLCALLANRMVEELPDGPELTVGLRKLLEAKDAFVRRAVQEARRVD